MKKVKLLIPQYMRKFHCIGSKCEDNCCYGWRVDIDKKTYKKYKKIFEPNLKSIIDKGVTRNRSNTSIQKYAKIKMNENSCCPFLQEDKLCTLQKQLGIDFLSDVCMSYPRITDVVNGIYEKSLTLSCPEAARLVLLNPNIMEFDEIDEYEIDECSEIYKVVNTDSIQNIGSAIRYFWPIRDFSISLIQNRKYSFTDRMIILGLFMKRVQEYADNNKVHEIPKIIDNYNEIIKDETLKETLSNINTNLTIMKIKMEFMKKFNDERFSLGFVKSDQQYMKCLIESLKGIGYISEFNLEDVTERYKEAYSKYYEPFMKDHEYIFENLFVNYIFSSFFPIMSKKRVFDDYIKLVIYYSFVKMLLVGIAAYNKKIDEELIVKFIYSFSRTVKHNRRFLDNTFKFLKENGYDTMAYMAILIKD